VPIPASAIQYDANAGTARFRLTNYAVPDYGNFFNAISPHPDPPPKPGRVSFDVRWHGGGEPEEIRNAKFGFRGRFVDGPSSIDFTAKNEGSSIVYRSVSAGQRPLYAGAGSERNGIFFV
jgi:hypothetical protein